MILSNDLLKNLGLKKNSKNLQSILWKLYFRIDEFFVYCDSSTSKIHHSPSPVSSRK